MKPHQIRYWLNTTEKDPLVFEQQVHEVCERYQDAQARHKQGHYTLSVDEMTGIQALERKHPTKPMRPGLVERAEFEYERHGTLTLIANFNEDYLREVLQNECSASKSTARASTRVEKRCSSVHYARKVLKTLYHGMVTTITFAAHADGGLVMV